MTNISAENLSVGYREEQPVLSNIFFNIDKGLHVLLGSNGSGKSTLLKTIAGLIKPLTGKILVDREEPYYMKRKIAAAKIAYTWQNPYYGFVEARVIDEIKFILETTKTSGNWDIVEKLVPRHLFERNPYTLSGGEAKRVSLASVLIADQPLWLLDEPFNELDYEGVIALMDILRDARNNGKTIIISSHLVPLMDCLEPDTFLLITRDKRLLIDEWDKLTDKLLKEAGVLPRSSICGCSC